MSPSWPSGGDGDSQFQLHRTTTHTRYQYSYLILICFILLISFQHASAQVGYGPGFDPCGDNCQTALRIFCTEGRNAAQQLNCWCSSGELQGEYVQRMDDCLATCDPAVSKVALQRDVMVRFGNVVCKGTVDEDMEFREYYSTRYGSRFLPDATRAAPPAIVPIFIASATKTPKTPKNITHTTFSTRTRTSTLSSTSISTRSSPSSSQSIPSTRSSSSSSQSISSTTSPTSSTSIPSATGATPSPHPSRSQPDSDNTRLNTSAIAGISVGSVLTFISILLIAGYGLRRRLSSTTSTPPLDPSNPKPDISPSTTFSPLSRALPDHWPLPTSRNTIPAYYSPDDIQVLLAPEIRMIAPSPDSGPPVGGGRPRMSECTRPESGATEIDDTDSCVSDSDEDDANSDWTDYDRHEYTCEINEEDMAINPSFYEVDLGEYGTSVGATYIKR